MEAKITEFINKNEMNELAKYILFNSRLMANNIPYRFLEIELYIYTDTHKDIFTHRHSKQKNMLKWYFHQMSEKEGSYKGGTFKGLDIACGFNGGYGGILIRSIMNENDNTVIEGPCNVVNALLKQVTIDSVSDLVGKMNGNLSCLDNDYIKLENKTYAEHQIYKAPRIGLTLKGSNKEEKENYINSHYRYILLNDKVKKEKKKFVLF